MRLVQMKACAGYSYLHNTEDDRQVLRIVCALGGTFETDETGSTGTTQRPS